MKPDSVLMAGVLHATINDPEAGLKSDSVEGPRAGAVRETTIRWNQVGELCSEKIGIDGGNSFTSVANAYTWLND